MPGGMPMQMSMPPIPGGMQMPMQIPMPPLPGTMPMMQHSTPPILMNHFECPNTMNMNNVIYEVSLRSAHQIEGIHVVPNNTTVADFEGKTKPDINGKPFNLIIYGRNIDNNTIMKLLEIQIHGGIRWAPILPQYKLNTKIDYLAFSGDFESLSIIVHGTLLVNSIFPEEVQNLINSGLPIIDNDNDDDYDEEEDVSYNNIAGIELLLNNFNINEPINRQEVINNLEHLRTTTTTLQKKLIDIRNENEEENINLQKFIDFTSSNIPLSSNCLVSVSLMSELIGLVFSFDDIDGFIQLPIKNQASTLQAIGEKLNECYEGVKDLHDKSSDVTNLDSSLGEEAATLIASFLIKALQLFMFDDKANASIQDVETMELLSNSTFLCCKAVLMNEYTSNAFIEADGLNLLCSLASIEPRLPWFILNQVIDCLSYAVLHPKIILNFITPPPIIDEYNYSQKKLSGYQIILALAENIGRSSKIFPIVKSIFNWCSLADSLQQLQTLSFMITPYQNEIVDAVSFQISKFKLGETKEIVDNKVHDASIKLKELLQNIEDMVQVFHIAFSSILESDYTNGKNDSLINNALVSLLKELKFLPCFLTIVSTLKLGSELYSVMDLSQDKVEIYSRLEKNKVLMLTVISNVLKIDGIEIMICNEQSAVNILWKLIAHDEHVLSCPSIQELINLQSNSRWTSQLLLPSIGWSFWLLFQGCSIINQIISIKSDDYENLNHCFEQLIEISLSSVGASAISILVTKYLLPNILQLLKEDFSSNPEGRLAVESGLTLLYTCIRQVDMPLVANVLIRKRNEILESLQENDALSLSLDMRSQSMITQVREILKTINFNINGYNNDNSIQFWLTVIDRVKDELPLNCSYLQTAIFACSVLHSISISNSGRNSNSNISINNIDNIIIIRKALVSICKVFQIVETKDILDTNGNRNPMISILKQSKNEIISRFLSPDYSAQLSEKQVKLVSDSATLDFSYEEFYLLSSLSSFLQLLYHIINNNNDVSNFKYKSATLIDEIITINAVALRCSGRNRNGKLGSLVRIINSKCSQILSVYR